VELREIDLPLNIAGRPDCVAFVETTTYLNKN